MSESPTRMPPLETERLVIREFRAEDLDTVYRILDVEPAEAEGRLPPSIEQRRRWLEWAMGSANLLADLNQPPYGDRAMTVRNGGTLIGACGLVPAMVLS